MILVQKINREILHNKESTRFSSGRTFSGLRAADEQYERTKSLQFTFGDDTASTRFEKVPFATVHMMLITESVVRLNYKQFRL